MIMDSRSCHLVILFIGLLHMQTMGLNLSVEDLKVRCLQKERQALIKFRKGLVRDQNQLSSWLSEEDCCQWRGVRCSNRTGHVIKLDLHSMFSFNSEEVRFSPKSLRGEINPSLIELQHLNYLDLSDNYFPQDIRIPKFIGSFPKLRYLNLSSTSLYGTIPSQLGNASSLRYLGIGSSHYYFSVDNLEWLSRISSLRYLDMSTVNLSKAVDWLQAINMLPHLIDLRLSSCQLPKVPIPNNVNFNTSPAPFVHSANNNNSSTFYWLFNVSRSFVHLDLSYNNLEGEISRILGKLCKLRYLDLSSNNLRGEIFEYFQGLSGCVGDLPLERLVLSGNLLSGYLPDFTRLPSLVELSLDHNRFNGTVPQSLGQLSNLIVLDLSDNSLKGVVSEVHFLNLSRLKELYLSSNSLVLNLSSARLPPQYDILDISFCKLGPQFPKWLHTQKTITVLDISNSGISDSIPDWFWDLSPNITDIDLSHNQISGQVPNLSAKLFLLSAIDLSFNQFEGPLPQFPSNVGLVDFSKNRFSGSISSLCNMSVVYKSPEYLDLSSNLITGGLSDCWIYWENLTSLNLADNKLFGKIPHSMGILTSLWTLHLRNNSLFGELPSSLMNCTKLESLDLSENMFSGNLPPWIGESLSNLNFLYLRSNEFEGHIPLQLCLLTSIQIFDLSRNNLLGNIPSCISNFSVIAQIESSQPMNILDVSFFSDFIEKGYVVWKGKEVEYSSILGLVKIIDLSRNNLSGEIPREITTLFGLRSLNLSENHLTGSLTAMIGRLWVLESLDLSRNQLSGIIPFSLSNLTFLDRLDLSYNNFSGAIPLGTQLQSFNASCYAENPALCGPPLEVNCSHDGPSPSSINKSDGFEIPWFYVSMVFGFVVGFWGFCGTLLFNKSLRYAYFQRFDDMKDRFFVTITVNVIKLLKFQS